MRILLVPSVAGMLALAAAMATIPPTPTHAFEFFGLKLFESQADEDADAVIADPRHYNLSFETADAPAEASAVMRNASSLLADEGKPASGVAGLLAKAQGDYRRITAALYQEGYYGGTVSILVNGVEASRIAPDAKLPDPVAIRILATSGPLFHFGALRVINQAVPTNDPEDQVESPQSIGFEPGAPAKSTVIVRSEQLLVQAWRQQGFAKAEIADRDVVADHKTNLVDVVLTVAPGRKAAFGAVTVQGTENMDPDFVRRQTGLAEGQEYDPDDVDLAQKRLARLEVFRSLRLDAAKDIDNNGLLPFSVIVQEQAARRFGLGATYSSIDGVGLEAFWLHRNLFGQAERLRLDAKVANIAFPIDTAEFDYAFGGTFTKPGVFTPDTDFVAAIGATRTLLSTYEETSASARVGLTHDLSGHIAFEASLMYERSQFEDDFGTRDFSIVSALGSFTLDNRDDALDASSGFYVNATLEPFYEFMYGNAAIRATAEGRTYFGFDPDGDYVLAGRLMAGALAGPDLSEIPPNRLFFAGGGGSVRGYGYKSIGVETDGVVSGGRYLLEGSLEARAKFTENIGGVAFVDGGYVAADTFPGIEDMRLGVGLGARYYTGLGPLRLDVAIPVNKREGDPDYALYVGIGQAF